ncbi:hypothetical protein GCM10011390_08420 [Aureimonas endophytica]|uniref:DUF2268 domain-containing protein n=1 Tax=Aureimonas endophytica TaxID=2027858 RepID=A0A917E0N7_9HYPH|nr:DUF2268 domain-containing putative Zn-dependent protease [Aureimonas endophytica]GGD91984.1 hypothetical protein GCM10011390_08420 [Aureimonas endophytica]
MDLRLHFLEANGSLAPWRHRIEDETEAVSRRIDALVERNAQAHAVDVVIRHSAWGVIPEIGLGGSCYEPSLATIALDPGNAAFAASVEAGDFAATLAHELHHAMRHASVGYGETLGEALVSEGLADHFACEVTGRPPPPWARSSDLTRAVIEAAERESSGAAYDHTAWFFGNGDLPRWAGYAIGWRITETFLTAHPAATAGTLVGAPASDILAVGWEGMRTGH